MHETVAAPPITCLLGQPKLAPVQNGDWNVSSSRDRDCYVLEQRQSRSDVWVPSRSTADRSVRGRGARAAGLGAPGIAISRADVYSCTAARLPTESG